MFNFIIRSFSKYFSDGMVWNPIFILGLVGLIIQVLKVIIDSIKIKKVSYHSIFAAGGFPSFHSGLATSVTTMAWLSEGFDSLIFAVCFAFSLLIAYDAMNVRFESGKQARCINEIRLSLSHVLLDDKLIIDDFKKPLKERLGHTPIEVLGGILISFILTFVLYYYLILM